ncbi:hypothetical protein DFP72DRAFT_342871 [Ephemerocybe angulata]|uniref:Uncharacterized protein n=1 Tax=Ephemerocybe angulata TaxID=980116 RepID=A0A8H6HYR8_9AGAR|nr:hypothetical protein DFP72DRAFT_342871 [Tulosesus angulatus]
MQQQISMNPYMGTQLNPAFYSQMPMHTFNPGFQTSASMATGAQSYFAQSHPQMVNFPPGFAPMGPATGTQMGGMTPAGQQFMPNAQWRVQDHIPPANPVGPVTAPAPISNIAFGIDPSLLNEGPEQLGETEGEVAPSNREEPQVVASDDGILPIALDGNEGQDVMPEPEEVQEQHEGGDTEDELHSSDDGDEDGGARKKSIKGRHVSSLNPIHGWVKGAGCGNDGADVPRTQRLDPPYGTVAERTKAYRRMAHSLLTKAESVGTRTGSWVYVAIQNPGSGSSFWHYTSPKLRSEGAKELQNVHKVMNNFMGSLMLGDIQVRTDKAGGVLKAKDAVIEQKDAVIEQKDAVIEQKDATLKQMNSELDTLMEHMYKIDGNSNSAVTELKAMVSRIGTLKALTASAPTASAPPAEI